MKKQIIVALLGIFSFYGLTAQNTVKGKVVNSETEKGIADVMVSVEGTNNSQKTSADGVFVLKGVPDGKQVVKISKNGFETQLFPLNLNGKEVNLGNILFYKDFQIEEDDSTISLSDDELSDDEGAADNTAGLLQSSKDVFSRAAAFNFPWFRVRGYDSENGEVLMNGIKMNKVATGRPQWSDWGGLNDVLRNQEFANGLTASDKTFGGVLGSTYFNTRASQQRKGSRISAASTNRNYSGRVMGTYNSGMNDKGWALSVSASRRYAQEGYYEGSSYNAWSGYLSAEKKVNDKHSFGITAFHTFNRRGKSSPNTQEVYDLRGTKYNAYWGTQDGKNRNSRMKEISEPMVILSHYWTMNDKTTLQTNVAYQMGYIGNSRIGYYKAQNPDPTYYKNLPSYALSHNSGPNYEEYYNNLTSFQNYGQVNYEGEVDGIYAQNRNADNASYYLYEDRNDDTTLSVNTNLSTELTDNITLNGRLNYSKLTSENYANMLDLMGAKYHQDWDAYAEFADPDAGLLNPDIKQYNLVNPDRKIVEGDKFNYDYKIYSSTANAFAQLQFSYDKIDFFVSGNYVNTNHQREGLYKNYGHRDNSLGKSDVATFNDLSFKGGLTYKITGRHLINLNGGMLSVAPNLRGTFLISRESNALNPDLKSQKITSFDASYIYRAPGVKARLTGYMTNFNNGVETAFYYAEGAYLTSENDTSAADFFGEITTGIDKQNMGVEFGMEVQVTPTIKITGVASVADFRYSDNADHLYVSTEQDNSSKEYIDFGTAYLKNYKVGGTAQQAYSLGFEYRDPKYWWFGVNANYISDNYINVTRFTRTDYFYKDGYYLDANGELTAGTVSVNQETGNPVTQEDVDALLTQEKFDPAFLLNAVGGKSWKLGNKYIGVFANISNILGRDYKTGGFEQARKGDFNALQADQHREIPVFGSKYWYGNKTTYYLNLYLRF